MNNDFNTCKACSDFENNQLVFHVNTRCNQMIEKHIRCPHCGVKLEISYKVKDKPIMKVT
ncbi:MAG: hypothetical protein AABY07_05955 [Nanoarchaeota archaeon]